ncbi:MAG: phosphoribosylanthranilate isomerase [Saccharofermentans sp.]|nr:phosphoribosylanthranilate isomerase [Saccharofermentans sp.]
MTPAIKICGLMEEKDILCVNELLPDLVGFMFWKPSKRYITPGKARGFRELLDPRVKAVGVFLDQNIEEVEDIAKSGVIDIVQLHGSESDEYIEQIKKETGLPVIKAFPVAKGADADTINRSAADMVLIDSGRGGTGELFNWEFLKDIKRDYFLAGGLSPENAGEAVKTGAYGLDVSSGVETEGKKDAEKIRRFITTVRGV